MSPSQAARTRRLNLAQIYRAAKFLYTSLSILIWGVIVTELFAYALCLVHDTVKPTIDPTARMMEFLKKLPPDAYVDPSWLVNDARELISEPSVHWSPFTYWRHNSVSGTYLNVDRDGIRRTWNMPATAPIEIYMFGGSTMYGIGARDDFTIPSCLSKMLAQEFAGRVHVTNYGQLGYVNTQEMITLLREVQAGKRPDVVIFYDGYNDTYSAWEQLVAGISANEFNRRAEFNILNPIRAHDFYLEVLKRSHVYKIMQALRNRVAGGKRASVLPPEKETQLVGDVIRIYQANATMIQSAGKTMGFNSVFYWQPSVDSRTNLTPYEQSWRAVSYVEAAHGFFTNTFAAVNHSSLAADPSFHDISDLFNAYEGTFYIDYAHTTERGNEIIARRMYRDVVPLLKQRIRN